METKSLVLKLSKIMGELGYVPKNGYNSFHKYAYVLEADLIDAVRGKLAENKIAMLTSVHEVTTLEHGEKGKESLLTTAKVTFSFIDAESGEQISVGGYGTGDDKGDKGLYKAITGAVKYGLMKNFLIPTGDDPERDEEVDKRADKKVPTFKASRDIEL